MDRGELVEASAGLGLGNDRFGTRERVVPLAGQVAIHHRRAGLDEARVNALPEAPSELERRRLPGPAQLEVAVQGVQRGQVVVTSQPIGNEIEPDRRAMLSSS